MILALNVRGSHNEKNSFCGLSRIISIINKIKTKQRKVPPRRRLFKRRLQEPGMLAADGKPKMPAENPLDEPLKIRKPTGKQLRSVPVMVPTPAPPPFWGKVSLILDSSLNYTCYCTGNISIEIRMDLKESLECSIARILSNCSWK